MASLDARLERGGRIRRSDLEKLRLPYFGAQVDEGYFVRDLVRITPAERHAYARAAEELYALYVEATAAVLAGDVREEFGLSEALWSLAAYTWGERTRHPHLFGRFDLAGVVDGTPPRLIEFNADTATVIAEAAWVQPLQLGRRQQQWNEIVPTLARQLDALATTRDDLDKLALVVTLGGAEDDDSARVWQRAANDAHIDCDIAHLPDVTFSPDEGLYLEMQTDEWYAYGILVKLLPWDWIDREEPRLLADLDRLLREGRLVVANPPYAALMQSKAMLAELWRRHPDHPLLLPAGWGEPPATVSAYASKPLFGREGENVRVVDGSGQPATEAPGDYGAQPRIWQAYTPLPTDADGDVYQAGVYWAGEACGLAYRRRDGLIVDQDAEFVGHRLGE